MQISIANEYGDVDVRNGLTGQYRHISGKRLQPLCRKLNIRFARALVEWGGTYRHPKPVYNGVVVSAASADKLMAAIQAREEKRKPAPTPELLPAIHAVNRAAKRWRDAAQRYYDSGMFGLASNARRKKESLYALKDRGIAAAFHSGRIAPIEIHAGLCLYQGDGYSFHSPLTPKCVEVPEGDASPITVEAKPQAAKEPRQRDAMALLAALPGLDRSAWNTLDVPRRKRSIVCFNCGEPGHIARECPYDYECELEDEWDEEEDAIEI